MKFSIFSLLFGVALLKVASSRRVVAYFNTGLLEDLYTDGVDQINFAFASVDSENAKVYLDADNLAKLERNAAEMKKLKEERPGLMIFITIGGPGSSKDFAIIAANQTKQQIFGESIQVFL